MNTQWNKIVFLLFILFLAAGQAIPSVTAESVTIEMELTPPAIDYTGTVTINGDPAPVGTKVTAYVDGVEKSSTTLDQEGAFDLTDALSVQGTRTDINKDITFSVTEIGGKTTTTSESKKYYPSDNTVLDINIGEAAGSEEGLDVADTRVDAIVDTLPGEDELGADEFTEITEPAEPSPAPSILGPLGTSQVIVTDVIQQALSPISRVQEIAVPIAMAIEQVEAITGLAIFDNFLAFLLIGFVIILFLILAVYRRDRETEEQRRARLRTQSNLLADQNRPKK